MKVYYIILFSLIFILLTGLIAPPFANDPVLPVTPYDYGTLNLPAHFTTDVPGSPLPTSINGTDNTPSDNLITDHGATLGRVLFYDKKLSANGTVSCASCHQAANGFSDSSTLSVGFAGGTTARHSMTLINARWYQRGRFFWDERAVTLEEQVLMPFQDPVEMGLTLQQLDSIVTQQSYYPQLFSNAFGDTIVTTELISKALAQFVRSIVSYSSKYDTGRAQVSGPGPNFPNFTAEENQGKQLFLQTIPNGGGACFGCHTTEGFISANPGPQNNGLDAATTDPGAGATFPGNPIFDARFKTSSLRNIELTAPYMHDGRFATLEEVVEHYNSGIQAHPTLSAALTDANGDPVQLNFTTAEKAALVAFLKTLTDSSIAVEPKWSDPFASVLPEDSMIVRINALLEGAYNPITSTMNNDLGMLIPLDQPFDRVPWNYVGTESLTSLPSDMVDWVLVEARSADDINQVAAQKAAILLANGDIVDNTGTYTGVWMECLDATLPYYFAIRSRNHLAVVSAVPLMGNANTLHDFTDSAIIQGGTTQLADLGDGNYALLAGDNNSDGLISVSDFNAYIADSGALNMYLDSDFNLDGVVSVSDFNIYLPNSSIIGSAAIRY